MQVMIAQGGLILVFGLIGGLIALRRNQSFLLFGFLVGIWPTLSFAALLLLRDEFERYSMMVYLMFLILMYYFIPHYCPQCNARLAKATWRKRDCPTCGKFPPRSFWGFYKK
jgi:hypothetical protein